MILNDNKCEGEDQMKSIITIKKDDLIIHKYNKVCEGYNFYINSFSDFHLLNNISTLNVVF